MIAKFLSTLSLRRATWLALCSLLQFQFLSTLSLRRATHALLQGHFIVTISIHALLAESDVSTGNQILLVIVFLSTLSLRRATGYKNENANCYNISIHALLAESDAQLLTMCRKRTHFYPRSPCGERLYLVKMDSGGFAFLSTLSLRRATAGPTHCARRTAISIHALLAESDFALPRSVRSLPYFYPRSPCGERHVIYLFNLFYSDFYPRSPCGERQIRPV